jgi:hypothetical protein
MEKLQKCINFILTVPVFFATNCSAVERKLIKNFLSAIKVSILKRVGSILIPRGVFRLIIQIIGCTFIVKIVVICV